MLSAFIQTAHGYPALAAGATTGTPEVRPSRSSRRLTPHISMGPDYIFIRQTFMTEPAYYDGHKFDRPMPISDTPSRVYHPQSLRGKNTTCLKIQTNGCIESETVFAIFSRLDLKHDASVAIEKTCNVCLYGILHLSIQPSHGITHPTAPNISSVTF